LESWDDRPERGTVVAVLSPRLGETRNIEITQLLHDTRYLTFEERIEIISGRAQPPYPVERGDFGRFICGHNPHLYARKVQNLRVSYDNGEEYMSGTGLG
jgi:hypothetical protein